MENKKGECVVEIYALEYFGKSLSYQQKVKIFICSYLLPELWS